MNTIQKSTLTAIVLTTGVSVANADLPETEQRFKKTRSEKYVSELINNSMEIISSTNQYRNNPKKRKQKIFTDFVMIDLYSNLLKIEQDFSMELQKRIVNYLNAVQKTSSVPKAEIDRVRSSLELKPLSFYTNMERIGNEIENYDNKQYWESKLFDLYYKNPLIIKCTISDKNLDKKDPYAIKKKLSTHLGDVVVFSDKNYKTKLDLSYTIMNGDSLKLSNPALGEYKLNDKVIRIDSVYRDSFLKYPKKEYVEGRISNLSSLLDELSMYIIRDIVVINEMKNKQ